jgi:hypothetical protein
VLFQGVALELWADARTWESLHAPWKREARSKAHPLDMTLAHLGNQGYESSAGARCYHATFSATVRLDK